jgi:hypothetical protein
MVVFDDGSINKLFNINSYFESNNRIPNKEVVDLLDKIQKKIDGYKFTISTDKIDVIPEHIKYIPIEITQLFCLIKPKEASDVDTLVQKINEMTFTFGNPMGPNLDVLFNTLKESTNLDNVPTITSIITPENDLNILGIDETAYDDGGEGGEDGMSEPYVQQAGAMYKKYKKYKNKYLSLKYK